MDEFSRLRGELYLSYAPGDPEGFQILAKALSSKPDDPDLVLEGMAELRAAAREPGGAAAEAALGWLAELGRSPYLDRYLADALRGREGAQDDLRRRVDEPGRERAAFACACAAGLTPFGAGRTAAALNPDRDPETLVDVLGYAAEAGLAELAPRIRSLLAEPLPWGVLTEARAALADLGFQGSGSGESVPPGGPPIHPLAQTLFHGDPSRSGKGSSGGVGTLVRELGIALADLGLPVLSLVGYDSRTCGYDFLEVESAGPGSRIRRIPVYFPSPTPSAFPASAHRIGRALRRSLLAEASRPKVLHVRFLDDASRASALTARSLGIPLALTLTPDPHRSVCGPDGRILSRGGEELWDLVNRIWIGDDLLSWSRGSWLSGGIPFPRP